MCSLVEGSVGGADTEMHVRNEMRRRPRASCGSLNQQYRNIAKSEIDFLIFTFYCLILDAPTPATMTKDFMLSHML